MPALVAPFDRYLGKKLMTGLVIFAAAVSVLLLIATRVLWVRVM